MNVGCRRSGGPALQIPTPLVEYLTYLYSAVPHVVNSSCRNDNGVGQGACRRSYVCVICTPEPCFTRNPRWIFVLASSGQLSGRLAGRFQFHWRARDCLRVVELMAKVDKGNGEQRMGQSIHSALTGWSQSAVPRALGG